MPSCRSERGKRQALVGAAAVVLLSATPGGCSEPATLAAWTIPIPEGTRIIEYPAVPLEARSEHIELVEDLVLGADESDPNQVFYRPTDVAVDGEGRLFVVDSGNHRVQVFDADGSFVRTLGREGQGPGEFSEPVDATIIGERLLVVDREQVRLSVWSTAGAHIDDVPLDMYTFGRGISFLAGIEAGHAVVRYQPFRGPGTSTQAIGTMGMDGELLRQYVEIDVDRTPTLQRGRMRSFGYGNPRVYPSFAAARDGNVYMAPGDEYQILASAGDESARWALRVAWARRPPSPELRRTVLDRVRANFPEVTESEINFLERLPSISRMAVDGRGRLFVYPYVETDPDAEDVADVPVDVFAADGRHLFSGMTPNLGWRHGVGTFVYGAGLERASGEYRVKRWQLKLPDAR